MGKRGRPPGIGNRHGKLLSCEHWPEAKEMILRGEGSTDVARFLRSNGEYDDVALGSTVKAIERYRADIEPVEVVPPRMVEKGLEKLDAGLDILDELESIIVMQRKRIANARSLEEKMGGILNPEIRFELTLLRDTVIQYVEVLQSLGLEPKVPEKLLIGGVTLTGQVDQSTALGFMERLAGLPPGRKEEIVQMAMRAEQLALDSGGQ